MKSFWNHQYTDLAYNTQNVCGPLTKTESQFLELDVLELDGHSGTGMELESEDAG